MQGQKRRAHGMVPLDGPQSARLHTGQGTALKPSHEPIVVARKPLSESSVAQNVLIHGEWLDDGTTYKHGTGAINIAATRVGVSHPTNSLGHEARHIASSDTPCASGDTPLSSELRFASATSALDALRSVASVLRSYNKAYTDPSPNGAAQDDSQPSGASFDQTLLDRLYPNGAWCGWNLSEAASCQADCSACRHLYDELFHGLQEAAQESPALLADALERTCLRLSEQPRSHEHQDNGHLSSSGALVQLSALVDLLSGNTSIPYSERQQPAGRWPSNFLLSHVSGPNGCQRVGTKRVKPGNGSGRVVSESKQSTVNAYGEYGPRPEVAGFTHLDPDGYEEIESFECVEGCPVAELDRQSGQCKSGGKHKRGAGINGNTFKAPEYQPTERGYDDIASGASRFFTQFHEPDTGPGFFYCAKSSRRERNAGLEGLPQKKSGVYDERPGGSTHERWGDANGSGKRPQPSANNHPTVKPLVLMRWLVRLVTPPGGVVLDPFAGSGTTLLAALQENVQALGIEAEEEYCTIAAARISASNDQEEPPKPKPLKVVSKPVQSHTEPQLNLFEEGA